MPPAKSFVLILTEEELADQTSRVLTHRSTKRESIILINLKELLSSKICCTIELFENFELKIEKNPTNLRYVQAYLYCLKNYDQFGKLTVKLFPFWGKANEIAYHIEYLFMHKFEEADKNRGFKQFVEISEILPDHQFGIFVQINDYN